MPTGVEEIIGLALGSASLLAGFASAVDGYRLLSDIFSSDNGVRSLAVNWHVEKVRFEGWGEHMRVDEGPKCLLHEESKAVRGAVAMVIAEIMTLQDQTIPALEKYGIKDIKVPAVRGPSDAAFSAHSKLVTKIRERREKIKQVNKVAWALQDKKKLQAIVSELKQRNNHLWDLVRGSEADQVRSNTAMLQDIRANQENLIGLLAVRQQINAYPESLLTLLYRIKELQAAGSSKSARQVTLLKSTEITILGNMNEDPTNMPNIQLATYEPDNDLPQNVFVEWKTIKARDPAMDKIVERINALGALLSLPTTPEFRRPTCIGTFDDPKHEERTKGGRRIAFVYQLANPTDGLPVSLQSLLVDAKKSKVRPPLGQRFLLAFRLASAVSLFHASDWLHKALRADNILFSSKFDVTSPWITGFQYSRPASDESLEMRPTGNPERDFYYHPDVAAGWTKVMDIYSLGILLWEIANWRPAFEQRFRKMKPRQVAACLLDQLEGWEGSIWDGLVGERYMNVVRCCLRSDFGGVVSGQGEQEAKLLGTMFFRKVMQELERCKA